MGRVGEAESRRAQAKQDYAAAGVWGHSHSCVAVVVRVIVVACQSREQAVSADELARRKMEAARAAEESFKQWKAQKDKDRKAQMVCVSYFLTRLSRISEHVLPLRTLSQERIEAERAALKAEVEELIRRQDVANKKGASDGAKDGPHGTVVLQL